jgi:hypothetical protein
MPDLKEPGNTSNADEYRVAVVFDRQRQFGIILTAAHPNYNIINARVTPVSSIPRRIPVCPVL